MPLSAAVLFADPATAARDTRAIAPLESASAAPPDDRAWGEAASAPVERAPLRCRLGLHRWLPLALSLPGSRAPLSVSFCRCCPAIRRPQPHSLA